MALALLCCMVNSLSAATFGLFTYTDNGTSITITRYPTTEVGNVEIPSTISGKPVTNIADSAFDSCYSLTSVTIPSSVTSIGDSAFAGCTGLTGITIPASVTSIGASAFYYCSKLTSVTIPASVTSIGSSAFQNCGSLTSITVDPLNSIYCSLDGLLFNKNQTTLIQCPGGKAGSVTIPAGVTSISDSTFQNCSRLTSVTIPVSVTSIGGSAFLNCTILTAITVDFLNSVYSSADGVLFNKNQTTLIQCPGGKAGRVTPPVSVTSIGDSAFAGCTGLTGVTIPSSVTSIGDSVFDSCTALTSVNIPTSVTSIGKSAFNSCTGLSSITIPAGVTSIGDYTFAYCTGLTGITIPASVTSIGNCAFNSCTGLTSVTIPIGVTSIGYWAFCSCAGLTSITIPGSVTSIGTFAFAGCTGLTGVTIPSSVTSIGDYAFAGCSRLKSIMIPAGVTSIGYDAFNSCTGLTSITIPASVTSIGDSAFAYCTGLTSASFLGNAPLMGTFLGNAPSMGYIVFDNVATVFKVYYFNNTTGFTSPYWQGYPAVNMGDSTPTANWLLTNGLLYNADLQSDPNGDGVNLLMAYALDLNPAQNLSASLPSPVIAGNQMGLTFYAGSAGVTYTVQTSTDLTNWSASGVTVSAPDANNVRTATVPTTDPNRFMRLLVGY